MSDVDEAIAYSLNEEARQLEKMLADKEANLVALGDARLRLKVPMTGAQYREAEALVVTLGRRDQEYARRLGILRRKGKEARRTFAVVADKHQNEVFVEAAKDMLPASTYNALWAEVARRQEYLPTRPQGAVGSALPMSGAAAGSRRRRNE